MHTYKSDAKEQQLERQTKKLTQKGIKLNRSLSIKDI